MDTDRQNKRRRLETNASSDRSLQFQSFESRSPSIQQYQHQSQQPSLFSTTPQFKADNLLPFPTRTPPTSTPPARTPPIRTPWTQIALESSWEHAHCEVYTTSNVQQQQILYEFGPGQGLYPVDPQLWRGSPMFLGSDQTVCFGRITTVGGLWERRDVGHTPPTGRFPVQLLTGREFTLPDGDGKACGRVHVEHSNMVHSLLDEAEIELDVFCTVDDAVGDLSKVARTSVVVSWPCQLDLTLYGPKRLLDELGAWLEDSNIFLQDPLECLADGRDAIYHNPQRLSTALDPGSCILVSELVLKKQQQQKQSVPFTLQDLPPPPDVLEVLNSHIRLAEAAQPGAIRTSLQSHQKQALTFMLQRERGWAYDSVHDRTASDMWQLVNTDTSRAFFNCISDRCQIDEPPAFSGGIIADPMGLGKTLTMIALVATDLKGYSKEPGHLAEFGEDMEYEDGGECESSKILVPTTLIVIPAPLIGSWEEQLSEHVVNGSLRFHRHHGRNKMKSSHEMHGVNVVLTSYDTVAAEWKDISHSSVLFSVRWRRIILDEAHFIRNGSANRAKAACGLSAISRWAVTGTPIQNHLGDLAALLSFIRAYPYTDPKIFDADISHLWKAGEDKKAANRLKLLSTYLILRRPKTAIALPPRRDLLYPVDLARAERTFYDDIRAQALVKIDEAMQEDVTGRARASIYANALQKIESLRLVCDLGLHYHTRAITDSTTRRDEERKGKKRANIKHSYPTSEKKAWNDGAQYVFNSQRNIGPMECLQCGLTLELTEAILADEGHALLTRCLKYICIDCTKKLRSVSSPISTSASASASLPLAQSISCVACGHQPACPVASVSTNGDIWEEMPGPATDAVPKQLDPVGEEIQLPSKVERLLADLRAQPPGAKCIVFSTWRLTLNVIQRGLDQIGMPSVRFDGKVPQKERQSVIDRFRKDPSIRVMLLTLSCGAVGLTLTVATRAYLMEPHWNPTIEEQALARIHRLGQTKEVATVRFYVRDSIEEQVMRLQESKKYLASVLLSHHDTGQIDDNLDGLHKLRSLL